MKPRISTLFFFCLLAACTSTEDKANTSTASATESYSMDCQNWSKKEIYHHNFYSKTLPSSDEIKYTIISKTGAELSAENQLTVNTKNYKFVTAFESFMLSYVSDRFIFITDRASKPYQVHWTLTYRPTHRDWYVVVSNRLKPPYLICTKEGCTFSDGMSLFDIKLDKENTTLLKNSNVISSSSLKAFETGLSTLKDKNYQKMVENYTLMFQEQCLINPSGYKISDIAGSLTQVQNVVTTTLTKYLK